MVILLRRAIILPIQPTCVNGACHSDQLTSAPANWPQEKGHKKLLRSFPSSFLCPLCLIYA
jgi:hypothetical protein